METLALLGDPTMGLGRKVIATKGSSGYKGGLEGDQHLPICVKLYNHQIHLAGVTEFLPLPSFIPSSLLIK